MGDPFNISVSIGGLIQLADLVVNKTWPFLREAKNQRSEVSKLSSEVASLAGTLHSLRLLSEGSSVPIKHENILECQMILESLQDKLKKADGTSSGKRDQVKKLAQQLCFPYERVEMQQILQRLERLKSTFNLTLTAESIASQIDLKVDVKTVKEELFRRKELEAKIELDEKRKKVLNFFGCVGPKDNHAMSLKLRHEGTGLWLLKDPRFNEWLRNCDSHIWFYGIPGAGKTVLASLIIEKGLQVCKPSEAVAYFYCDYKDTAKQDPCHILASIASQIAIQHEKACEILEEEHRKIYPNTDHVKQLKPEILVSLLKKQLCLFDSTTLIIDGLDECGDSTANVLDHLVLLAQESRLALRLAILSRDEFIIRKRLTEIDCESISIAASSTDIRLFAASEIEQRVRSGRLLVENPSTKELILQKLIDKAQGMFRWVACQLDFICDLTSDDEYCKALDVPAPTLFEIYERLLLRLQSRPKSTQDLVRSALIWILFPLEPLNIKQLCEAVTVRTDSEKKPAPAALNQIRKFCSSLIREAADGKHLEAAHFTVKEFFNYITKDSHPHIAHFCLSKEGAYLEFSEVCLTYLNFKDFYRPIPPFECLLDAFEEEFYKHAVDYWAEYAENHWTDENVLILAKQLFKPPMSTNFKLWRNLFLLRHDGGDNVMERITCLGDSLLHWAAYFGIHQLLEWLVSSGQDIDFAAALGTPLSAAMSSWAKCEEYMVAPPYLTFELVESLNLMTRDGGNICINILVQKGARTEHIYECEIGDKRYNLSLRELLLCSGDIQVLETEPLPTEFFDEAVATRWKDLINDLGGEDASEFRTRVVRILRRMKRTHVVPEFRSLFDDYVKELEDDIVIDYEAMDEIWTAARNDQADVLETLLKEREDIRINEKDGFRDDSDAAEDDEDYHHDGKNALHHAASAGSVECIQVLMDAGASIHITTNDGSTSLHLAAGSPNIGAKQCVEMLLNSGLSLEAKNDQDWTALHFAAFSGHPKTVELLLRKGSDPHLVDKSRCTAYHLAASNISGNIMKPLPEDEKGGLSGMHVSDLDGFKPAQLAVVNKNSEFIGELLKHIDIRELAIEEEPFLLFVAREGSAEMIRVVLRSNPDFFVRGKDQSTILHAMGENHAECQSIIIDMIKKGVSRSDARNDGSLPLHVLLSGRQTVTKELLDLMIEGDPNRVDGKQNNYLMCLLRSHRPASQKKDTALDLIKLGVDAFRKNDKGDFFYHRFIKTIPESALQIIPHINDLGGMDKVHWILSGWLTIHFAIINGDLSLVETLLEKGSSLSKQTGRKEFNVSGQQFFRDRLNCMHVAALYDRKDILEYVLGASNLPIDCRDGGGGTALHLAAFHGSDDCVKLLLSKGANAKLRDDRGDNALHYGVDSKALSIIEMLVEAGTPIVANHKGESPIDLAIAKGQDDIAELLRKYQATGDYDGGHDLSRVDEIHEVVSSDLPFRFGSRENRYTFGFNSQLTLDLSKAK